LLPAAAPTALPALSLHDALPIFASADVPAEVEAVGERVERAGGQVLARYRDPLGGRWLVLAVLPIDRIEPTPYQRELSEAHVKRDRKSTRLNSSHVKISYAVFCL